MGVDGLVVNEIVGDVDGLSVVHDCLLSTMSIAFPFEKPLLSPLEYHAFSFFLTALYVGSIYISKFTTATAHSTPKHKELGRNHPDVIKARMKAVLGATTCCVFGIWGIVQWGLETQKGNQNVVRCFQFLVSLWICLLIALLLFLEPVSIDGIFPPYMVPIGFPALSTYIPPPNLRTVLCRTRQVPLRLLPPTLPSSPVHAGADPLLGPFVHRRRAGKN